MACKTGAGKLRQRITIQKPTRASDSQGGGDITWSTFAVRQSDIQPKTARERLFAARREVNVTHTIRLRYDSILSGITGDMRILFGTRIFQIHGTINEDERNRWIVIMAEEGVAS